MEEVGYKHDQSYGVRHYVTPWQFSASLSPFEQEKNASMLQSADGFAKDARLCGVPY